MYKKDVVYYCIILYNSANYAGYPQKDSGRMMSGSYIPGY